MDMDTAMKVQSFSIWPIWRIQGLVPVTSALAWTVDGHVLILRTEVAVELVGAQEIWKILQNSAFSLVLTAKPVWSLLI
jgi:hypothetical protein